jgi:hypothetical protein
MLVYHHRSPQLLPPVPMFFIFDIKYKIAIHPNFHLSTLLIFDI